jgi:hypothetical protein
MLQLKWLTCGDDSHWCSLQKLDLSTATQSGVYVIWHKGNPGRVVYVGQGNPVCDRFAAYRRDTEIQAYAKLGDICVTWASVPVFPAGLDRHFHDIRGTTASALAAASCTEAEIGAITGHAIAPGSELAKYIDRSRQLAINAYDKWSHYESAETGVVLPFKRA